MPLCNDGAQVASSLSHLPILAHCLPQGQRAHVVATMVRNGTMRSDLYTDVEVSSVDAFQVRVASSPRVPDQMCQTLPAGLQQPPPCPLTLSRSVAIHSAWVANPCGAQVCHTCAPQRTYAHTRRPLACSATPCAAGS